MNTTPWHEQKTISIDAYVNEAKNYWTGSEKVRKYELAKYKQNNERSYIQIISTLLMA